MNHAIREFSAFAALHEKIIRRIYERARGEVGFDLSLATFSSRLHGVVDNVLAEGPAPRRRVERLLGSLEASDLYLATAAAAGNREALARLHRWYGPLLRELGEAAGRPDLEEDLIGGADAPPPLAGYLGLGSLRRWLLACAARALAPARPVERLAEDGPRDPEARRAFDLGPARAYAMIDPEPRFALALHLAAGMKPSEAAALSRLPLRRVAASYERLLLMAERESNRKLERLGKARHADAWSELRRTLGRAESGGRRALLGVLARDAAVRVLGAPAAECPDPNFLLGALEQIEGVARREVLHHAAACWPCLSAAKSLGPPAPPTGARARWLPAAAALIGFAVLGWSLIGRTWQEPPPLVAAADSAPPRAPAAEIAGASRIDPATETSAAAGAAAEPAPEPQAPARELLRPAHAPAAESTPMHAPAPTPAATTAAAAARRPEPLHSREARVAGTTLAAGKPAPIGSPLPTPAPPVLPSPSPSPLLAAAEALATPSPSPHAAAASPARSTATPPELRLALGDSRAAKVVNLAVDRYRPGLETRALSMIGRALEIDPELAVAHFDSAVLLERSGEHHRAQTHWARYLQLAVTAEDVAIARDRLRN